MNEDKKKNPVGNPVPPEIGETESGKALSEALSNAPAGGNSEPAAEPAATPEPEPAAEPAKRSNRDLYREEYGRRYPDMDMDDEEAMYGKGMENLSRLDMYEKGNKNISDAIGNNTALAGLLVAASHGEDPWEWLAENLGVDMIEIAQDPAKAKKISEAIGKFNKSQADAAETKKQREENVRKSLEEFKAYVQEKGIGEEEALQKWVAFNEDLTRMAIEYNITKDDFRKWDNGRSYDQDIETARQEGAVSGRNEKISEQLREGRGNRNMPPTLGGTSVRPAVKREEKKRSEWSGLD